MNTIRAESVVNNSLNYTYDNIYQLVNATSPILAMSEETFSYDALGNRLNKDGQTTNSRFNLANRLLEDPDFTYSYDNNGNMIQKSDKLTNDITNYGYDAENRLIHIGLPRESIAQYRYDTLGRRIEKNVDGVITRYVYDGKNILFEFDGSNTQVARYTHGIGIDKPLIMERDGQSYFYHADGLGSIIDLIDVGGFVVQSYVYDSFGNIVQQEGALVNPYTYTGRELDLESGMYYYRARFYDSNIGRFITQDPIGMLSGSLNFYSYVGNNSINFIDPLGLQATFEEKITQVGAVGPLDAIIAEQLAKEALEAAKNSGLTGLGNGPADAYRHCYWSCLMAQKLGADQAKDVGDIHEKCGNNKAGETAMDLNNNHTGIVFGESGADCHTRCFNAALTGALQTKPGWGSTK